MKRKICIFNESISKSGGIERVTINLANMWAAKGYDVEILTISHGHPFYKLSPGIKVHSLNLTVRMGMGDQIILFGKLVWKVRKFLKNKQYDFLIAIWTSRCIVSIIASMGLPVKVVACEHIAYGATKTYFKKLRNLLYPYAAAVISLTDTDRKKYLKLNNHAYTIENAVGYDFFNLKSNVSDSKVILAVGRETPQKGFDLLVESWHLIYKKYPTWQIRIVGDNFTNKTYATLVLNKIKQYGLQDTIHIISETNNIKKEYSDAAFYVMASRYEGLPMVLLEAMAAGLPAVSFDCPTGPREIIKDGETGILVRNGSITELAKSIAYMIENVDKRKKYGMMAHLDVKRRFSTEAIAKKWDDLFNIIS